MEKCEICNMYYHNMETHHVVGRVGKDKNKNENLIRICHVCHYLWHNNRSKEMENYVYKIMKDKHGDKFPINVNGVPYKTKWIMRIENEREK